jgi:NADPH:quinone reductase-like Zn-dependent oxidoreductase
MDEAHTLQHAAGRESGSGMRSAMMGGVMVGTAEAFWLRSPGKGEIRAVKLATPRADEVLVRTLYSAISRGTEALVARGEVPQSLVTTMRAPFQDGDFPGPVKYGYLNVGVVEQGPTHLVGCTVFCLYPHQTRYVVPADAVVPVPQGVPPERAVLGGLMETAVNALWDAAPLVGDRVAVVGAGAVGCCVAALLARIPGTDVQLVDVDPGRAGLAERLGVRFALPAEAGGDLDVVVHTSATSAGLATSLGLAAPEATVLELSWYGNRCVEVPLGEVFHPRRLLLRSSQVGSVAPARRDRRTHRDRLALALDLLADPALDILITGECSFADLPDVLPRLARGELPGLCLRVRYPPPDADP